MYLVPKEIYNRIMSLNCQSEMAHLTGEDGSSRNNLFVASVERPGPTFPDFNPTHDTNLPHVFPESLFDPNFHPSSHGGGAGGGASHTASPHNSSTNHTSSTSSSTDASSLNTPPPSNNSAESFDLDYDVISEFSVPSNNDLTPPIINEELNASRNNNNLTPENLSTSKMSLSSSDISSIAKNPTFTSTPRGSMTSLGSIHQRKNISLSPIGSTRSLDSAPKKRKMKRKFDESANSEVPYKFGRVPERKEQSEKTYPKVDEKYKKEKINRSKEKLKTPESSEKSFRQKKRSESYPSHDKHFAREELKRPEKKPSFKKPSNDYPSIDPKYKKERISEGARKDESKKSKKSDDSFTSSTKGLNKKKQQQAKITEDILKAPLSNPYAVLGVNFVISKNELKKTFKTLTKIIHPDKNLHESAHQAFVKLTEAYNLILQELEIRDEFAKDYVNPKKKSSPKQEESFSYRKHYRPHSEHEEKQTKETERIMKANRNNLYEIFNLPENINLVELKAQFYILSQLIDPRNNLHPDAVYAFTILQDSYKLLYDKILNKMKEEYTFYGARPKTRGPPTTNRNTDRKSVV